MKIIKAILKLFWYLSRVVLITVIFLGIGVFVYHFGKLARHYPEPFKTVTEQVKSIQRQVGCEKIDAVIGPETMRLVNEAVKREEQELFNQYAMESMARMSGEKE